MLYTPILQESLQLKARRQERPRDFLAILKVFKNNNIVGGEKSRQKLFLALDHVSRAEC